MGLDGGVILKRPDMLKAKTTENDREEKKERNAGLSLSCWQQCTLTGEPLEGCIVVSKKGQFFNRKAILEALTDETLPKKLNFLKKKKNWKEIDLLGANSLLEYVCPISSRSPCPGTVDSWVVLFKCGHMFIEDSLKHIKTNECPVCGCKYEETDLISVTPIHQTKVKHGN